MNIRYAALAIVFTWLGAHHSAHADGSEPSQRAEADSTAELLESARLLVAQGDDEHLAGHAGAYAKRGELYKRLGEDEKSREDFNRSKDYDD